MKKFALVIPIAVLAVSTTACATKGYVNTSVGQVNEKVGSLSKSLEETQERTRQNEQRIQEVDDKYGKQVAAVDEKAGAAGKSAATAQTTADRAILRADEVERSTKKLIYEVTLSEASGNFKFGSADLPEVAQTQIEQLIERLKSDPDKGGFIEIEGHTDNVGEEAINQKLGLDRAEAVQRYLHEQHQVPLHKMSVISYGEEKPEVPNTTKDGRAQNRRVIIRVLS